jgi:hypothetical protein
MAVMNLESLVLRGVNVVRDVVTGLKRIGANQAAVRQTPAMVLSHLRHPSQSDPWSDADPALRYERATAGGSTAKRAGRPGSSAGVLGSRNLASFTRGAILSGWQVEGGPATAARCIGQVQAKPVAAVGEVPPGQSRLTATASFPAGWRTRQTRTGRLAVRREVGRAWSTPAGGMPLFATRGLTGR